MASKTTPPAEDEHLDGPVVKVGYRKPPVANQFGKGNPGRPKGSSRKREGNLASFADVVEAALTRPRKTKRGDKIIEMPAFEYMVESIVTAATSGTMHERFEVVRMVEKYFAHKLKPSPQELSVTYHRAPGSQVELPPADLWRMRQK